MTVSDEIFNSILVPYTTRWKSGQKYQNKQFININPLQLKCNPLRVHSVAYTVILRISFTGLKKSLRDRNTLEFCSFPAYATEDDILRFLTANF